VLFSTTGLGVRLMEQASAWQIVFYRGLFQTAAIGGWLLYRYRGRVREAFVGMGRPGLIGALALAITNNSMILSLKLTSVAAALLILSAAPAVAAVLGWWLLDERVPSATLATAALALAGVGIMTLGEGAAHLSGNLAALVAVSAYSVFVVALRKGRRVDMLPCIALSGMFAALMSSAALDGLAMSARDLALSAYLGGVALALGFWLFTLGSRHLSAAELPLVGMTEPVLAPFWVWLLLGETVGTLTWLGGGLVLGSIGLHAWFTTEEK
jgi:drug/metabolite transporter, DME family